MFLLLSYNRFIRHAFSLTKPCPSLDMLVHIQGQIFSHTCIHKIYDTGVHKICMQDTLVGGYLLTSSCAQINSTSAKAGCTSQANQTCTGRLKPEFAAAYNGSADYPRTLVDKAHDLGIGVIISFSRIIFSIPFSFLNNWCSFLRYFAILWKVVRRWRCRSQGKGWENMMPSINSWAMTPSSWSLQCTQWESVLV